MASTVAVLLLLSAGLFTVAVGYGNCKSYYTSGNVYKPSISCGFLQHCCGTCDYRYCCSSDYTKLTDDAQNLCNRPILSHSRDNGFTAIVSGIMGIVVICIVFFVCCCCPCCCIYKMCQKPRPVVGTHVTTVVNTQCIQQQQQQQPVMHGAQYPAYQPVPTQPGYGGQPMQMGPYQGQPYAPGPPPPYHMATSPGYPSGQAAYGGSQATHPMLPPAQPDPAHLHPETFKQPAYNPAYMQPPNTGY